MTFLPSLNIFDAFELVFSVVNFVYYGKTRIIYWLSAQIFSHMISIDEFTKLQYGHFKCSDK